MTVPSPRQCFGELSPTMLQHYKSVEFKLKGCSWGNPGQQRHSSSSNDLFWLDKTIWCLRHWFSICFHSNLAGIIVALWC